MFNKYDFVNDHKILAISKVLVKQQTYLIFN